MKPILKTLAGFLLFLLVNQYASAASDSTRHTPSTPLSERIYTGGNMFVSFGSLTYIYLSPLIGFRVTPKFSVGPSFTYIYYKDNRTAYPGNANYGVNSSSIYGGSFFARYLLFENVFAHAEYEVLSRDVYDDLVHRNHRIEVSSFYVGGGFQQRVGQNSFMNLLFLWNLNESRYSLYANPIIRGGFNIGF